MTLDELLKHQPKLPYMSIYKALEGIAGSSDEIQIVATEPGSTDDFSIKAKMNSIIRVLNAMPDVNWWCNVMNSEFITSEIPYFINYLLVRKPIFPMFGFMGNGVSDTSVIVQKWMQMVSSKKIIMDMRPFNRIFSFSDSERPEFLPSSSFVFDEFAVMKLKALKTKEFLGVFHCEPIIYHCSVNELVYLVNNGAPIEYLIHLKVDNTRQQDN